MFYSHTFLGRKGPLGTVWCAAHLQHKLKKSHYAATDIPSTVERILFPEVPISLRMQGHLLLGVVRIYSKKLDYLFHDCNVVLIGISKAFTSSEVNLPEDATHAPFHSITLPDTFELASLDLDDNLFFEGIEDNHLKSQDEITLPGQIPVERDPYVSISFDEDIMIHPSHRDEIPDSGVRPMEEEILPSSPVDRDATFRDPGPSNQSEVPYERIPTEVVNKSPNEDNAQDLPDVEVMRDPVYDHGLEIPPDFEVMQDPAPDLGKPMNENEILSPIMEEMSVDGEQVLPFQQRPNPPSAATEEAPDIFDSRTSFGHVSPELEIRATPPIEVPKANQRKRKRILYDEVTVLSNRSMKNMLQDSSCLFRKRRMRPCSALSVWKFSKPRNENIFFQPSLSGSSSDLQNIFKKDFISTKPHLVLLEEDVSEQWSHSPAPMSGVAHSPASVPRAAESPLVPELDMEIERIRHNEDYASSNILADLMPSPPKSMPSQHRKDEFTPISANTLGTETEPQVWTSTGTDGLSMPDLATSTGPFGSDLETPIDERLGAENTGLSDIPELINSAEAEGLSFLEADINTAGGSQGTQEFDDLSVRTRAVAQYLQRHSPIAQISEELSGDLSLNKILEGKTRKLCARMFFETLVLKSSRLIDVQQEEPFGDITLKLTPTLSKAKF
ncbi:sister chromatid cohesion 1 protein 3 isoform X2 [Malania oleifera]|uniref:sister chromatid cohesion 1 protein 3 isoform X2 n=1 Tax=Malania oleifera TaxID=397392 RepID=UPI0025AE3B9B|nr:sister chromatid cohesion 1 protein 3 isoform X2 [Malania oleifera]